MQGCTKKPGLCFTVALVWYLNITCYALSGLAQDVFVSTVRQLTLTSKSECDVWHRDARRRYGFSEWRRYFYQGRRRINTEVLYCVPMSVLTRLTWLSKFSKKTLHTGTKNSLKECRNVCRLHRVWSNILYQNTLKPSSRTLILLFHNLPTSFLTVL